MNVDVGDQARPLRCAAFRLGQGPFSVTTCRASAVAPLAVPESRLLVW